MRLKFRAKLLLIVGAATLSVLVVMSSSTLIGLQQTRELNEVEHRMVPRLELEPRLNGEFAKLRHSLQDAVQASDMALLVASQELEDRLLQRITAAQGVLAPRDVTALRNALQQYYTVAQDVSRRLIAGETGEALVLDMAAMQAAQARFEKLVATSVTLDYTKLEGAFRALRGANQRADQFRLAVAISGLLLVLGLSGWLSRSVLGSLRHFSVGLARFATGDFSQQISSKATADLGDLAHEANHMARSLKQLAEERDRHDWLKEGQAELAAALRGEPTPSDMAASALSSLVHRVKAVAGALYLRDERGNWSVASQLARGLNDAGSSPHVDRAEFAAQGLIGRAALGDELLIVDNLPEAYLKVQSGLGEASPKTLLLLPFSRGDKTLGVVELALFDECSGPVRELLRGGRETLAMAFEASVSRAELRELLAETREQADRLVAQEEELRISNNELQAQQEELRVANGELEQQRQALRENNTNLENARQHLQDKANELSRVSAYKSQFLANMSHELRTPLNSMLLLSHLLAENEVHNLSPRQVEHCRTIHAAGEDLLKLINQILDLAKIEAGRQEVSWKSVPVDHFAEFVRRRFRELASEKGLDLIVETAAGLPSSIVTDRQRMERILTNLVGNAIKFTSLGSVSLKIQRPDQIIRFDRGDLRLEDTLAFVVTDTGAGIERAAQDKVFLPFEQIEASTDRRYGGTGLGLAIARESAKLLGGELCLESSPGLGSQFICFIPERPKEQVQLVSPPAQAGLEAEADALAATADKPHLLIIEDDPVVAEQLAEIIQAWHLNALTASTGAEGIRLAHRGGVVGIILDVRLPDIDGWTVMERLRQDPVTKRIPVHFVTAVDTPERGIALGAVGYLVKPVTHAELTNAVFTLTRGAEGERPKILVVEDDATQGHTIIELLRNEPVDMTHVSNAEAALQALEGDRFGCMILDLGLPDMDGLNLLERVRERIKQRVPRVIVHTGRALTKRETTLLESYSEAVILKDERSGQRLVEEVRCFVRHLKEGLSFKDNGASREAPTGPEVSLAGRKILLAEDDMRTVYALSALMLGKGAQVLVAENGREALDLVRDNPDVHCVLMDIMMPEMDGYEAMRQLRQDPRFANLIVIALTAKAMKGERERCIAAGASDYLAKPVDAARLLETLDRWLGKEAPVVSNP